MVCFTFTRINFIKFWKNIENYYILPNLAQNQPLTICIGQITIFRSNSARISKSSCLTSARTVTAHRLELTRTSYRTVRFTRTLTSIRSLECCAKTIKRNLIVSRKRNPYYLDDNLHYRRSKSWKTFLPIRPIAHHKLDRTALYNLAMDTRVLPTCSPFEWRQRLLWEK